MQIKHRSAKRIHMVIPDRPYRPIFRNRNGINADHSGKFDHNKIPTANCPVFFSLSAILHAVFALHSIS